MKDLLLLYWPTILAAALSAASLSFVGALLATRQAGVQTLAVSQSAGFGVSLGILLSQLYFDDGHIEHTLLPLTLGLASSAFSFVGTEWIARKSHTTNLVYLASFAMFWGLSQMLVGFFPVIESHATALYFGDIVTLTWGESLFFMALGGISLSFLLTFWRGLAERAFLASILEEPLSLRAPLDIGFYLITLLLLCFSVQLLGLLFTASCLFLPTTILSFSRKSGVQRHLTLVVVSAALAAGFGFSLSLAEPRFLTTPLITLCLGVCPLMILGLERGISRCK